MVIKLALMIIAFLGILIGAFIGRHTYEELKKGEKYFILFKNLVLGILAVALLFSIKRLALDFVVVFIVGFLIAYFLRYTYFFLGLSAVVSIMISQELLIMPLIYLYGLPFGTIRYYHIKGRIRLARIILINFILFMLPLSLLLFEFDVYMLMAFSAGALIAHIR